MRNDPQGEKSRQVQSDCRIRVAARRGSGLDGGITIQDYRESISSRFGGDQIEMPAKEWSISEDVLTVSDAASVSIANINGECSGLFQIGARIEIDLRHPRVEQGKWMRQFTGRITRVESSSDIQGGTIIVISAMDFGWHLTSCDGTPLVNIKGIKLDALIEKLIDPSWQFAPTKAGNDLNKALKHGRLVIIQNHKPVLGAILPYIQVEPGQKPIDLLRLYAQRDGVLLNVGSRGELIFFQPEYDAPAAYVVHYHPSDSSLRNRNNLVDKPTLVESIDEVYSEVQCWSTVVIPSEIQNTENPNEMYRHSTFRPDTNPLPFERRLVFSDPEAINDQLRLQRAKWKWQMGMFQSWEYAVEFGDHMQAPETQPLAGLFFGSDRMITVRDTVHQIEGTNYIQKVQKSFTLANGSRAKLLIRQPGLLNPQLDALPDPKKPRRPKKKVGGGAEIAQKKKQNPRPRGP